MRSSGGLLDAELAAQLGPSDKSNPLLIVGKKKRKKPVIKNRRQLKLSKIEKSVERKKTDKRSLDEVYDELRKTTLPLEQWNLLQQCCLEQKKRKRRQEETNSDDTEMQTSEEDDLKPLVLEEQKLQPVEIEMPIAPREWQESVDINKRAAEPESPVPLRVVYVDRTEEVKSSRSELPIIVYEQEIMELITTHDVVVLCGPTGCGKTTQVPQFLYEAGYGCPQFPERKGVIGVTQPRRLAAISIANRVAEELHSTVGGAVGYQIRHESRLGPDTRIKFMTDGVLIRELQDDFCLSKYSALVIDEAHERSLNTDLMIGMLTRVVSLRHKLGGSSLKVVIMSATLEAGAFLSNKKLFKTTPPVFSVPSRQFPVTIHFSKKTEVEDYEGLALRKVCRIHRELPPGGILVFLTGKRQIEEFCQKLQNRLERDHSSSFSSDEEEEEEVEISPEDAAQESSIEQKIVCQNVRVLPLYALLPPHRQALVFEKLEPETRLIVVSTNVAETSITIPGIRYVVDAGRAKKKIVNPYSGVASFEVDWVSKASAVQRAGRAGRTLPGHCYRLYSSAHFSQGFLDHDPPEIEIVSIEGVALILKSMGITKVENFPFPSAPDPVAISAAEHTLMALSAVEPDSGKVTQLGQEMVQYPISPRHSKLILKAINSEQENQEFTGLSLYSIALAAAMSVESPFLQESAELDKKELRQLHKAFKCRTSDSISSMLALLLYRKHGASSGVCQKLHLNIKVMKEMASLEQQLLQIFLKTVPNLEDSKKTLLKKSVLPWPSEPMLDQLRKCILSGWCDQVARKDPVNPDALIAKKLRKVTYHSCISDAQLYIHPSSVLAKHSSDYVVYTTAQKQDSEKIYIYSLTHVEAGWLFDASSYLSEVIYPSVVTPGGFYDENSDTVCCWHRVLYGKHKWELPLQAIKCKDADEASTCFATVILDGKLLASQWLNSEKLTMMAIYAKTIEAKYNKRLGLLIQKIKENGIWNRVSLKNAITLNSDFLKLELKYWIKKKYWEDFDSSWRTWTLKLIR